MKGETDIVKMNKREFLKTCFLCSGGIMLGMNNLDTFARTFENMTKAMPDNELWKWSKETYNYSKTPRGVRCATCPNRCELGIGDTSKCKSRINHNGKLYSIAYGNPCAVHIDPIEKKPLNHFLPGGKAFSIAAAG